MGTGVTTLLMDSHVVHWWASEPDRVSPAAALALSAADELAVASITWFELAWLAQLRIPLNPITHSGVFDHPRRRPRSGRREGWFTP